MKYREYVLAELRAARARSKLYTQAIDEIGVMLKRNMIEPDEAIEALKSVNCLDFLHPEEGTK